MNHVQEHRGFYIFESIIFIILGFLAVALPGFFTLSFELLVGLLFVIAGLVQLFRIVKSNSVGAVFTSLILSLLYIAAGVLLLIYPVVGILSLTILISVLFFIQGIFQLFWACSEKSKHSGWWVFSGLLSIAIALIVWFGWPETAVWFIGLLVGVNLLFTGITQLIVVTSSD